MKFQIIYFSKMGNTQKIADAIASEIGVKAEHVKDAQLLDDSFVFLGSGCYGKKPATQITIFIEDNDFTSRNVALFGTSGSGEGFEVKEMERKLQVKQACIKGTFSCKGKFLLINRGRPSTDDVKEAKKFAKQMIQ